VPSSRARRSSPARRGARLRLGLAPFGVAPPDLRGIVWECSGPLHDFSLRQYGGLPISGRSFFRARPLGLRGPAHGSHGISPDGRWSAAAQRGRHTLPYFVSTRWVACSAACRAELTLAGEIALPTTGQGLASRAGDREQAGRGPAQGLVSAGPALCDGKPGAIQWPRLSALKLGDVSYGRVT
jgi:hypothetical protein